MCEQCKKLEKENMDLKILLKQEQLRLLETQIIIIEQEYKEFMKQKDQLEKQASANK